MGMCASVTEAHSKAPGAARPRPDPGPRRRGGASRGLCPHSAGLWRWGPACFATGKPLSGELEEQSLK